MDHTLLFLKKKQTFPKNPNYQIKAFQEISKNLFVFQVSFQTFKRQTNTHNDGFFLECPSYCVVSAKIKRGHNRTSCTFDISSFQT